jgi:hypothetical protein
MEQSEKNPAEIVIQPTKAAVKRIQHISNQQRHDLASKAAKQRWAGKNKKVAKGSLRVFSTALNAAEKRLAKAIEERAKAANLWAVLSAEIPSLQQTIAALKNQQNPNVATSTNQADLATMISGRSASASSPAQPNPIATSTRPLQASRARGAAVDVNLEGDDDENKFLDGSDVAAGEWH